MKLLFILIIGIFNFNLFSFFEVELQRDLVGGRVNTRPYLYKKILLTDTYKFCENPIQKINFLGYDNKKLTGKPVLYIDKSKRQPPLLFKNLYRIILKGKIANLVRGNLNKKTYKDQAEFCKINKRQESAKYFSHILLGGLSRTPDAVDIPFFGFWSNNREGFRFWIKVTKEHKDSYEVTYKGKPIFIAKSSIPLIIEKKKSGQEIFRDLKIEKIYQEIFRKFREVIASQDEEKMKEFFKKYVSKSSQDYYKTYLNLSKKDIEYLSKVFDLNYFILIKFMGKPFELGNKIGILSINESFSIDLTQYKKGVFKISPYLFEQNCEKVDCFKNQHKFIY